MQSLTYSVKNRQFKKKRHIFFKDEQKQNMSLSVHDSLPGLSQLVQQSRSDDQSQVLSETQPVVNRQEKEQLQILKLSNNEQKKINNGINGKYKNSPHSINTTAKIKVCHNQQLAFLSNQNIDLSSQQLVVEQLSVLKGILLNNEQRITHLMDFVNSLCRNTIQLYNNHQKKLRELVNIRCCQIAKIYKSALRTFKTRQQKLHQMDGQITLLLNTLKDTKQSLRLTKIKQQCIEALQKQWHNQKKQPTILNINSSQDHSILETPKSKAFKKTEPCQQITYGDAIQFKNHGRWKSDITPNLQLTQSIQNFGQKSPLKNMNDNQEYQKSPFETNQMLMISSTMPIIPKKTQISMHTSPQYSFRKHQQALKSTCYFGESKNLCKPLKSMDICSTQINTKFIQAKIKLQQVLKQFAKKEVWLDSLNCLRFKNGSYVLDGEGNAFIFTQEQFQKLMDSKVITQQQYQN